MSNTNDGGAGDSGNQNAYARDERGLAAHHRAHRFTASMIYDLPFRNVIARDWQFAGVLTLAPVSRSPRC
jgi:hypothetical protein